MALSFPSRRQLGKGAAGLAAAAFIPGRALAKDDTVVTISSPWGADHPFQQVVDAYNARKTGIRAVSRLDGDYQEMATKALANIASGRPPEMMITGWKFGYFARRTLGARNFFEIDSGKAEAIISQFKPSVRPLVTIDNALIGLPWAMSTPVTWINMNLWRDAGLDESIPMDVSHTWLLEQAAKIEKALGGKKHPTYRSAIDLSNNEWTSQAYIQNAGGFILQGTSVVCDSPEAVRGIAAFAEPVKAGLWKNLDFRAQNKTQIAGSVAIVTTSSARAAALAASDIKFKDVMFPGLNGNRNMNSGGNFLAVYARNDELAKASMNFLQFCASKEGQTIWSDVGYLNTSIHDISPKPLQEAANAQLAQGLTSETIWPGRRGLEGQDVWRRWVARVLEGVVSPEKGMAQAKAELTPLLAES
jgi:multiple sugar transport system substrate-binding protein